MVGPAGSMLERFGGRSIKLGTDHLGSVVGFHPDDVHYCLECYKYHVLLKTIHTPFSFSFSFSFAALTDGNKQMQHCCLLHAYCRFMRPVGAICFWLVVGTSGSWLIFLLK